MGMINPVTVHMVNCFGYSYIFTVHAEVQYIHLTIGLKTMKTSILFLMSALLIIASCKEKERVICYPILNEGIDIFDNPYSECKKGDIITVSSMAYEEQGVYKILDKHQAKLYANGVSSYCSLEYPIISLGSNKINVQFHKGDSPNGEIVRFNQSWFDCVYIGNPRKYR